jgi:tetratricopeptide (TPR) repeat protein
MNVRHIIVFTWMFLTAGAVLCLSQAPASKQQEFVAHVQKAQTYLREKRPDLAIPELQAAVDIHPDNVDMQANLGVLLFFAGKTSDAIPHLRAAVEKDAGLTKIRGLLGIAENRTSDFAAARTDMESAFPLIQERKFKTELGLELVGLYTQSGDLDKAAAVLAVLRKTDPDNAEVMYAAYRTYTDLTVESMLSLSLTAPNSAQMHQMMAHELTRQGKTNEAIEEYRKAIAINSNLPGIHFELAELLNTSQDPSIKIDARKEYLAALKSNPRDEKAECSLADMDALQGNIAQAYDEYSKAVALQPGDANAKLGLAKMLINMHQPDKALPLLEQAVQLEPTSDVAHYRLATLYRNEGRVEDAKREVELYKKYKDLKEKLRVIYKDLQIRPAEINPDDQDEK